MIHPPQEPDVVPGRTVAGVGIGVIIATIVGVLVAYGLGQCRMRQLGVERAAGAREQVKPEASHIERTVFGEEAAGVEDNVRAVAVLDGYAWVDRAKQIVRIPVERAYPLVIARQRAGGKQAGGKQPEGQPAGGNQPEGQQAGGQQPKARQAGGEQ